MIVYNNNEQLSQAMEKVLCAPMSTPTTIIIITHTTHNI
jgi:hypothetical protein